jgi:protein-S-isoprenylcysteine O-methyltransferase Ste14
MLLALAGVLMKVRREENALRQHFGTAYEEYAHRVPALVPGLP